MKPRIGNLYKFSLVFVESIKMKRLERIRPMDVTFLSATYSEMLLRTCESPLILSTCDNEASRRNFMKVYTHLVDDDVIHARFSPFSPNGESGVGLSQWFCDMM